MFSICAVCEIVAELRPLPETITQIIEFVTSQLIELIQTQKTYLTEKITFLRTATKQLNTLSQLKENLPNIIPVTETPEGIV